ncbi:unnamed protein product, partial [marine sediment metagenome]
IRVCIAGQEGELDLTVDATSNGNAYWVTVPAAHDLTGYTNPATGANYNAGERVQNIIPASFGATYRPIPKDNTVEITPLDASDWFLDEKAGVLFSETDLGLGATGTIACYVYVGDMVDTTIANILDGTTAFTDINATDIVDSDNYNAGSIDYEHLADDVISGAAAVGTFESGDTILCLEAGVGLRECDYDDLPSGAETNDLENSMDGVAIGEIAIGQSGGDVGVYWVLSGEATMDDGGVVTIADSVAVTSWNLTTPTVTTSLTTSTP